MVDIIKRDPFFSSLFSWPRWFDELEEGFLPYPHQRGLKIYETENDIKIEAVVAGVSAKDVDVEIEDGVLKIKAESKKEEKIKEGERKSYYRYYYTTALSGGEWDKATAEIKNGIVTVSIPKTKAEKGKKIKVKEVKD